MPASPRRHVPIFGLLTDFGSSDHYVASIKGTILSRIPSASFIDISHDVEPGGIRQAAFALWAVDRSLPSGCVTIVVVDPEVGSDRKILLARANGRMYVAPDNGVLDHALGESKRRETYHLDLKKAKRFLAPNIASTFHGRDIFAPVACALQSGRSLASLGTKTVVRTPDWKVDGPYARSTPSIISVDRFGNIITNIVATDSESLRRNVRMVSIGNVMISVVVTHFAQAPTNTPCMLSGSSGMLEITVRNGSAATMLRATDRSALRVMWGGEK